MNSRERRNREEGFLSLCPLHGRGSIVCSESSRLNTFPSDSPYYERRGGSLDILSVLLGSRCNSKNFAKHAGLYFTREVQQSEKRKKINLYFDIEINSLFLTERRGIKKRGTYQVNERADVITQVFLVDSTHPVSHLATLNLPSFSEH